MAMFGPLQMFAFGFPGNEFNGQILPALDEAREKGITGSDRRAHGHHLEAQGGLKDGA